MIELKSLCRDFQVGDSTVHALADINLDISPGEHISIMGPSGSGKSTLLNILGLLDTPTSGSYLLDGVNTSLMDDNALAVTRQTQIGFIFQTFHLVPRMSAAENVELPMLLEGQAVSERRKKVAAALDRVGLAPRMDHRPSQLSGGERQRVAIARAIVMQPKLLLADEPTGNLDTASGTEIVGIMEALNEQGLTLVVVTHDPDIGERARRRLALVDGRIAKDTLKS